jgi:hypothetical protein
MKLFPYHDVSGQHYPELDTREVSVAVMSVYMSLSRVTTWDHAMRGDYGRTQSEGAWFRKARVGKGGQWVFRPAVIFRRKGWGRFTQVGFDPLQLEGRIRLYHCDPLITEAREAARVPNEIPAEFRDVLRSLSGSNLEAMAMIRRLLPNESQTLSMMEF